MERKGLVVNMAENDKTRNFMIISIGLFVFFVLENLHTWANDFSTKLHFCNHTICIYFSLIFVVFAYVAWKHIKEKKPLSNTHYILLVATVIVGLIIMNMTYCDANGNMRGDEGSFLEGFFIEAELDEEDEEEVGVSIPVPIPPCIDTDAGRDYISRGSILSGVDIEDRCMGDDVLRERYCDSVTTYTSEDISCSEELGSYLCEDGECVYFDPDCSVDSDCPSGFICEGGECTVGCNDDTDCEDGFICLAGECVYYTTSTSTTTSTTTSTVPDETNCGDGIDNDGDTFIDCADTDCDIPLEDGGCADFEFSCQHTSPYPTCGGTCPTGEECIVYMAGDGTLDGGWCECMPEEETSCGDSGSCDGWCLEYNTCTSDTFGCFCTLDTSGDCTDTDGGIDIYVGGYSLDYLGNNYIEYCGFETGDENTLYEYYCLYGEASDLPTDCEALGLVCIEPYPDPAYCGEGTP